MDDLKYVHNDMVHTRDEKHHDVIKHTYMLYDQHPITIEGLHIV